MTNRFTVIVVSLLVAFLVFAALRGSLRTYLGIIFGTSPKPVANATTPTATPVDAPKANGDAMWAAIANMGVSHAAGDGPLAALPAFGA